MLCSEATNRVGEDQYPPVNNSATPVPTVKESLSGANTKPDAGKTVPKWFKLGKKYLLHIHVSLYAKDSNFFIMLFSSCGIFICIIEIINILGINARIFTALSMILVSIGLTTLYSAPKDVTVHV